MKEKSNRQETTIYYKRNTSEFWAKSEFIPDENTVLIAEDTGVCKFGDGVHKWSELKEAKDGDNNE